MKKKILFIIGSVNQTSQLHQIAAFLQPDYDCYFTQYYANSLVVNLGVKMGLADNTILGGSFKANSDRYLKDNNLPIDYKGEQFGHKYDLVVTCSDMIVPANTKGIPTIWVQEGMIDRYTKLSKWVKKLCLPRYLAIGTSLNGSSDLCDVYCTASQGYKDLLVSRGTSPHKMVVTGSPNFDHLIQYENSNFLLRDFVLVATSDIRETLSKDDRMGFLENCVRIAKGRQLVFKLHPNENHIRAIAEINSIVPDDTLIYTDGNAYEMISHCTELITQYSTLAYVGLALGKEVHSYFDIEELKRLLPWQNEGRSAYFISQICRDVLAYKFDISTFRAGDFYDFNESLGSPLEAQSMYA